MMIDMGADAPIPKSATVDASQRVRFTDWTRADRVKRQIIEAIEAIDDPDEVRDHVEAEQLILDALHLFDPSMAAEIDEFARDHRAALVAGACPRPAVPGNTSRDAEMANGETKGKTMNQFASFDTGGSSGPLILWSVQGTDGVPAESFYIRDENGKTEFDGFAKGVVIDVDTLKTGWQTWEGEVPKWTWNPSVAQMMPRPSDEHKKGWEANCAIGGGETALISQAGAAMWGALVGLVPALQQQPQGKLPLVKMTGIRHEKYNKGGKTAIPVLEVVKWVDRPDCLKSGFAAFSSEPKAPAKPAPAPEPAMADDDDLEF